MPQVLRDTSLNPGIVNQDTSIFNYPNTPAPSILGFQVSPTAPLPDRTSTATVVRMADGKARVLNGPYIESREQLGGYYLIEAADLEGALAWAARCPGARQDAVEVRPLMVY